MLLLLMDTDGACLRALLAFWLLTGIFSGCIVWVYRQWQRWCNDVCGVFLRETQRMSMSGCTNWRRKTRLNLQRLGTCLGCWNHSNKWGWQSGMHDSCSVTPWHVHIDFDQYETCGGRECKEIASNQPFLSAVFIVPRHCPKNVVYF